VAKFWAENVRQREKCTILNSTNFIFDINFMAKFSYFLFFYNIYILQTAGRSFRSTETRFKLNFAPRKWLK